MDTEVDAGALTDLHDLFVELLANLGYNLLDACGMDTTVGHQLMQGQACHLAADGIECRDQDSFRGIVHHDLDADSGLQSSDVAAFAADDATLDFVVLNIEYCHCIFDGHLGSGTLDGVDHNALGLFAGGQARLVHHVVDV